MLPPHIRNPPQKKYRRIFAYGAVPPYTYHQGAHRFRCSSLTCFFFLHSFLIDFEHQCSGHSVRCWMDCMAPEYLSVRLVICIWIIYLVQRVLARATSQSDSDAWLKQLFVSVPLLFKRCFSFSFLFRCPLYYILLVAIWDFQSNHNHAKSLWSTWKML